MKQFYTKVVSDEVFKALHDVKFPFCIMNGGLVTPQLVECPPDYAQVLDWFLEQGVQISIGFTGGKQDETFAIVAENKKIKHIGNHFPLIETFDKAILLAIEFLKEEQMKTYDEFVQDVWSLVEDCPKSWRKGQSVFNVIDDTYGVARIVQFEDHVDCFYDDTKIDEFMQKAYEKLKDVNRYD